MKLALATGVRVRTTRGLARAGTIKCIRSWDKDKRPRSLDIAWDDDLMEVCTFVDVRAVEALDAVDQLGSLVAA